MLTEENRTNQSGNLYTESMRHLHVSTLRIVSAIRAKFAQLFIVELCGSTTDRQLSKISR